MRPLMTRFCVFLSLESGVTCLCIVSILVSGGLICNHQFKIPVQIKDWRNASIYNETQLDMLELNRDIAIWVLVGDIMLTLFMLLPVAMTDIGTPWKKRNCIRKILIPCFVGKILCILHGIAGFVWFTWKFHYDCPEIIGILLAFAVYVLLGCYLIVAVISYYLELGMRRTFHKLPPSKNSSASGSQHTKISYQRAELSNSDEIVPVDDRNSDVEEAPIKENGKTDKKYSYEEKETYKGSNRKLYEYDREDGREKRKSRDEEGKRYQRPEKLSHSSHEGLENKRHASRERLRSKDNDNKLEDREEQYRKLLNKSTGSQGKLADDERHASQEKIDSGKRHRSKENIRQVGPDGMRYRVSEKEAADGEGKRRYYYKTKSRDHYRPPSGAEEDDELNSPERPRHAPPRYQRDSEGSLESLGRVRSPPKYSQHPSQSDGSHDDYERTRRPPRYEQAPRKAPPRYNEERRYDDEPTENERDRRHPRYNDERRYDDAPREYEREGRQPIEDQQRGRYDQSYENPVRRENQYHDRRRYSSRDEDQYPERRYEPDDDYDYDGRDYVAAPPYVDTRYEDGYISSEV